ncbi:hypothetical protein [Spongiactinospora sp. TRM90649]|uniref:esterase/lipase family protein n=1 Tax=Spongiactinospora sp. TRM90649 TaxID=3031114 RepID=UPI0023F7B102|nr:hypothetical protein [Spongiactinospora sp. TRM90649]MDF5752111.1 hypothetical protein [Spongiactinospora sp. TRM90649]
MVDFRAGDTVRIGDRASLKSTGVNGSVAKLTGAPGNGARANALRPPDHLAAAIANAGMRDLELDREVTIESTARAAGRPKVLFEHDAPPPGECRVALAATVGDDGYGMLTWHRMDAKGRFAVERTSWNAPLGWAGKLLVKIFGFAVEGLGAAVAEHLVTAMEERSHRYRLRACLPASYAADVPDDMPGAMWADLVTGGAADRRALLLLHGAFGRSHTAFGGLPPAQFARLHRAYGGRVFAFDHYTLVHDPAENVRRLVGMIPDGSDLHLDVLTHSRGGLVARELVRHATTAHLGRRRLRVGNVIFVGTPNGGTILADAQHRDDLLDRMTTLLSVLGGGSAATEALALVLELVKLAAAGASAELPGLTSMDPRGEYLRGLNTARPSPGVTYHALGSDFEPSGAEMLAQDLAADLIFPSGNDLIVPSEGVGELGSSGSIASRNTLILTPREAVHHSAYFSLPKPSERIMSWLCP